MTALGTCSCDNCGALVVRRRDKIREKTYCSRRCASLCQVPHVVERLVLTCSYCSCTFSRLPGVEHRNAKTRGAGPFCSKSCARRHKIERET